MGKPKNSFSKMTENPNSKNYMIDHFGEEFSVTAPIEIVRSEEFEEQKDENKFVIFSRF